MFSRQVQGSPPALEPHEILDKLHGLQQVISPRQIQQALQAVGCPRQRRCLLSHEVMLWVVLGMGLLTDLPIRQVFKHARRLRQGERSPCRSALCEARQRLGVEPVRHLFTLVVRPLATPATPGAFYKGFRLMGADGTVLDAPDSQANASAFPRAKGGRGGGAFPQVRKVSLVELGTHVETVLALGGWQDSETALVEQLYDLVPKDALLLEDRGFFSHKAWKALRERDLQLLVRIKSHMVFKPLARLADGSFLAKIYPCDKPRRHDEGGLLVRVIEYTRDDPQRAGHQETHRLMTSLLDEASYPAEELILLYHERWEEELTGGVRLVDRPLRGAGADGGGGRADGAGRGPAVVRQLLADPGQSLAGVRQPRAANAAAVVRGVAVGDAARSDRAATRPGQPEGDQAEDVEGEEEAAGAPRPAALDETL